MVLFLMFNKMMIDDDDDGGDDEEDRVSYLPDLSGNYYIAVDDFGLLPSSTSQVLGPQKYITISNLWGLGESKPRLHACCVSILQTGLYP